ncbi:MAG TPA: hypothetical protein VGC97_24675 [Pyrinomonadaceae bacterium]
MFKKGLLIALAGLLALSANTSFIFAQTKTVDKNVSNAEKVKAGVLKRGTNEKKTVRVKMLNGTKLKGSISQIGDDSFTLTDSKTKQPVVIAYRDTARVEGRGLSGGARIGIFVVAGLAVTVTVLYFAIRNSLNHIL